MYVDFQIVVSARSEKTTENFESAKLVHKPFRLYMHVHACKIFALFQLAVRDPSIYYYQPSLVSYIG